MLVIVTLFGINQCTLELMLGYRILSAMLLLAHAKEAWLGVIMQVLVALSS